MSIRAKVVVACLCCALIPLLGYAGYTYARTVQHLGELENDQLAAREIAVAQALDDVLTEELANVGDLATWPAFVEAAERGDVGWLREQLAAMPDVAAGGSAQLFTPDGELLLAVGASGADSLWLAPEVQRTAGTGTPAAGYETLDGRLSLAAAGFVTTGSDPGEPVALLAVARPVDEQMLGTIGSYAGVRVAVAPPAVAERLTTATSAQAGSGVVNQFGETFTDGDFRRAYLGVNDTDGYRSGLIEVSMERSAVSDAIAEIRTMALVALGVALAVAALAALLISRRISRPLQELAVAATAIAAGETSQDIRVSGSDEVGQLAGAFATMSQRITERVTDLSEKIRALTEEFTDLNVVFGETLADTVDVEAELGHDGPARRRHDEGGVDLPVPGGGRRRARAGERERRRRAVRPETGGGARVARGGGGAARPDRPGRRREHRRRPPRRRPAHAGRRDHGRARRPRPLPALRQRGPGAALGARRPGGHGGAERRRLPASRGELPRDGDRPRERDRGEGRVRRRPLPADRRDGRGRRRVAWGRASPSCACCATRPSCTTSARPASPNPSCGLRDALPTSSPPSSPSTP